MLRNRAPGGLDIETHLSAKEAVGAETAEHKIRVCYGRPRSAASVTGRARIGASALRPDPQGARCINERDAAAAGAHLADVDHRHLHRQSLVVTADERDARCQRLALVNDAGLGGGAAHVESDRVLGPDRLADRLRADDAGSRARFEHADALRLCIARFVEPAARLHDEERAAEARGFQMLLDFAQIGAHARPYVSVGNDSRTTFEFTIFLRQFMRAGHKRLGHSFLHDLLRPRLVRWMPVGMQEHDRHGLDAKRIEPVADRVHAGFVENLQCFAVRRHPLLRLEAQRALRERLMLLEIEVVGVRPVDPADLVDIAKAPRGDQRGLRAGALEHCVDRDGRAMQEDVSLGKRGAGQRDAAFDSLDQMMWGRQRLTEQNSTGARVEGGHVGERTADVGRDPDAAAHNRGFFRWLRLPHDTASTSRQSAATAVSRTLSAPLTPRSRLVSTARCNCPRRLVGSPNDARARKAETIRDRRPRKSLVRRARIHTPSRGLRLHGSDAHCARSPNHRG